MEDLFDSLFRAAVAFGAGYFLGGTWQAGIGAVLLQLLFARNMTDVLTSLAKIAKIKGG
jgi:hypothetical protein